MRSGKQLSLLLLTAVTICEAASKLRYIPKTELPSENGWISLDQKTEFLPATTTNENVRAAARHLATSSGMSPYDSQPFANGVADYSSYQQAWRMLGFMIDCDVVNSGEGNSADRRNGRTVTAEGCQRYVVWAAYVDEAYEGGGIGEYQFWNQANQEWDTTPCNYGGNNKNNNNNNKNNNNNNSGEKRCAKMDCHLEDTHWTMLGFFKHKSYNDWFGQLFKHEGYCIWDSDQYSFMKNAKGAWPGGCTQSDKYIGNDESKPLYYDLKPTSGGGITVGLYTDTKCVKEYSSKGSTDAYTIESVLGNFLMNNRGGHSHDNNDNQQQSDLSLSEAMSMWDEYFSIYKICQPCVAHDLDNVGYNGGDKGSAYGTYTYGNDDYYSYYNKGADFDCYDDAGYTNVNQCMKFMAKTYMETATYRDLALAKTQNTFVDNPVHSYYSYTSISESSKPTAKVERAKGVFITCCFFIISSIVLAFGMYSISKVRKEMRDSAQFSMSNPLVMS